MKKNIIIGSRGSILALAQANLVKNRLQENYPNLIFEIKEIITTELKITQKITVNQEI